jgi:hypothetical protein
MSTILSTQTIVTRVESGNILKESDITPTNKVLAAHDFKLTTIKNTLNFGL